MDNNNNDIDKTLSQKYCPRFGRLAVEKGYITAEQLKEAVSEQIDDNVSGKPHRVIGTILFEKGWLTNEQLEIILIELFKYEKTLE